MKLNEVRPAHGAVRPSWRRGQGPGSGNGKTGGRGSKGQKSRSGYRQRAGFEGGQMPLHRRLPKRGFVNPFRQEYAIVNLSTLERLFADGAEVTFEAARKQGLLGAGATRLKLLGKGELTKKLVVHAHRVSEGARTKVEAAGGRVELAPVQPRGPKVRRKKKKARGKGEAK